jgi:Cu/Ag efflux protein CusF
MKTKTCSNIIIALTGTALLALLTSCSSTPQGTTTLAAAYQPGVPGGVLVHTFDTSATVTGIDPATRKVTLVTPDGTQSIFKAGPDVVNFDQIRIGDQVKTTIAQQLVVFMSKDGSAEEDGQAAAIALAPEGAKPGVFMADTTKVTAKVKSVDLKRHRATLLFPDGKAKTFDVRPDVDLTKVKPDDEVSFRITQALAIRVEKP